VSAVSRNYLPSWARTSLAGRKRPTPLLPGEKRAYLLGIQEAIAGVDEASVVLAQRAETARFCK